jgi:UbiD family decarboxylase
VLFDDVPGYPRGHRVLANILTSVRRINLTLGLPADAKEVELVQFWRQTMKAGRTIPPVTVASGALLENVREGDDIDLFRIPVPKWHEHDGGYYIGTGCMVIMRDPDTGWINYGAYRVQAHDRNVASVMCSKGKHGDMIQRKYHERGEPCPVAVVCGMHPALFMIAGLEIPHGKNEYDAAGGLIGEPVEVILGPKTGLPIPANAEIAFEGFIHANDRVDEGPLGEWTGYYAGGKKKEPAIRVATFMHRDDPILLGAIPGIPPDDDSFYRGTYRSGAVWNQLEAAGVPEVKGVWAHAAGGSRLWLTVSIKQMYAGHAKQAGLIASQCHAGAYVNRFVVVVDDDIDPADMDKVVWAMCTRFDPREGMETLRGCWSSSLDPMGYGENDPRNARVVIDACRPWVRRDTFPKVARSSAALDERIRAKFAAVLPKGA